MFELNAYKQTFAGSLTMCKAVPVNWGICLERVADREYCAMDSAGQFVEEVYQQSVDFYKQLSSPFPQQLYKTMV